MVCNKPIVAGMMIVILFNLMNWCLFHWMHTYLNKHKLLSYLPTEKVKHICICIFVSFFPSVEQNQFVDQSSSILHATLSGNLSEPEQQTKHSNVAFTDHILFRHTLFTLNLIKGKKLQNSIFFPTVMRCQNCFRTAVYIYETAS